VHAEPDDVKESISTRILNSMDEIRKRIF